MRTYIYISSSKLPYVEDSNSLQLALCHGLSPTDETWLFQTPAPCANKSSGHVESVRVEYDPGVVSYEASCIAVLQGPIHVCTGRP